jgi:hypothetical protein
VHGANGAIFGDTLFAAAEHVGLRVVGSGLNLDRRLLLSGIERKGLSQYRGESVGVFEIGQPTIALRCRLATT